MSKERPPPPRWEWKKADRVLIAAEARNIYIPDGFDNARELDEYVDYLHEQLQRVADAAAKRRKVSSPRRAKWWNKEVSDAVRDARRARRAAQATPNELTRGALAARTREQKKAVREA
ncbi:hypothetical protein diail_8860 [Diaporthe ilicicola]|nr:hypothetical protein diail_8860 [Diaporthe ilicicola]